MLDTKLTQLALKIKNMVVMDLHFPSSVCPEFRKNYEPRFIHVPCRQGMILEVAGGLASSGKIVVVVGYEGHELARLDPTLSVKVLKKDPEGTWEKFEEELRAFGPSEVLIPD